MLTTYDRVLKAVRAMGDNRPVNTQLGTSRGAFERELYEADEIIEEIHAGRGESDDD